MTQDAPIAPPPEPNEGQRARGCLHIAADLEGEAWRYCGRPPHRGAWCVAHYAAIRLWPGLIARQRLGESIVRVLAGSELDEHA